MLLLLWRLKVRHLPKKWAKISQKTTHTFLEVCFDLHYEVIMNISQHTLRE